ncbi:MAG: hypothetical protein L0H74_00205 [Brachybacterium sp.]|nr:hypothetical protein [Brachybacterium sp.]
MTEETVTPLTGRDRATLSEVACDLIVVEHRLRDLRRWTPEATRCHLDAALDNIADALDCLHVEPGTGTSTPEAG